MSVDRQISMAVNGVCVTRRVEPRRSLADFLRYDLQLTGTHVGCDQGVCGACSVRVDGVVVRGCLMFAVQADGAEVESIEGLTDNGEIADLQDAFHELHASQCGFCTAGMLMTAAELLKSGATMSRDEIRSFIGGNYCRCTGYQPIVDAIETVMSKRAEKGSS